jgi:uncharacterized protein YggE
MKQLSMILNAVSIGLLVLILLAFGVPVNKAKAADTLQATPTARTTEETNPGCDAGRTVQVSGTAAVNVVPDRALIQLGVQSNAASIKAVQAANTAAIRKVIDALQSIGIASKDIATDWYVIQPLYDNYDSLYIKGYRINNVVAVTLRDVGRTSEVIAVALGAGANQVVNVEFYTSELRKYRDQARELAMKAASEKAQALTGAAGTKTGCVLHIDENTWSYYNGGWYGRSQNLWTQNTVQNAAPAGGSGEGALAEAGPVSLGQISIQAKVDVTFGLK